MKTNKLYKDTKYIKSVITKIFNNEKNVAMSGTLEQLVKYINDILISKDIFNVNLKNIYDDEWFAFIYNLYNSPFFSVTLTELKLIVYTVGFIKSNYDYINQYKNAAPMMLFKLTADKILNSSSFYLYNKLISEEILKFATKNIPLNTTLITVPVISAITGENVNNFFVTTLQALTTMYGTSYIKGYFSELEKNAIAKQQIINAKTTEEITLSIEQEIIKRGQYKQKGLSNDEIADLLDTTPDKDEYKITALNYMNKFYKLFRFDNWALSFFIFFYRFL
jgi:hypothetical protein